MVPVFGYGERVCSSAAVKSSFHKLKNVTLKYVSLPTDMECFLENHIRSLRGALLLHSTQESETNVVNQIVKPIDDSVQTINNVRELEIKDNNIEEQTTSNNLRNLRCPLCKPGSLLSYDGAHKCNNM